MIELFVSDNDVTNGSIAVSWCVSTETLDWLAKYNSTDPQLVICIVPQDKDPDDYGRNKEYRKIVPLKDLMTYLEFRVAGKNNIFAQIELGLNGHRATKKDYFRTNIYNGGFLEKIPNSDGTEYSPNWASDAERLLAQSPIITVNVPKGCFAKEPPAWEKVWVNHLFHEKAIDECHYRRRRLFAYTVQPILAVLNMSLRLTATLIALAVGARNISFAKDYLLHPLSTSGREFFDYFDKGSFFIRKGTYPYGEQLSIFDDFLFAIRKYWKVILMPIVLIPLILMALFYSAAIIFIAKVFAMLIVLSMAVIGVLYIVVNSNLFKGKLFNIGKRLFSRSPGLWYMDAKEIEYLSCSQNKITNINQLPKSHKTFKLRFQNLKSKVCRPFSA